MSTPTAPEPPQMGEITDAGGLEGTVRMRYWASVRAAQGRAEEQVAVPRDGASVAWLLGQITADRDPRVAQVVAVCSVLVDELVVHAGQAEETLVRPGSVVDLLPPFAGG